MVDRHWLERDAISHVDGRLMEPPVPPDLDAWNISVASEMVKRRLRQLQIIR